MSNIPRYEGGGQMPEPNTGMGAPPSVIMAVRFMYVGAVLSAISLVVTLATIGSLRTGIRNAEAKSKTKLTPAQVTTVVHVTEIALVIVGLIGIGVWIWMAMSCRKGRNWARITGTVFFGLYTLSLIGELAEHQTAAGSVVALVVWLVGLGAVIYLWKPASTAYFKAPRYLS